LLCGLIINAGTERSGIDQCQPRNWLRQLLTLLRKLSSEVAFLFIWVLGLQLGAVCCEICSFFV